MAKSKSKKEAKPKALKKCEACQGTGLELPEGDIKYKSQAKAMCDECQGSGQILK